MKKYQQNDVMPIRIALSLLVVLCIVMLVCLTLLYKLAGSRPIVNCYFLGTQTNAQSFLKKHPEYAKRLDRNGNGKPCENMPL